MHPFIGRLAKGVEGRCALTEMVAVAFLEGQIGVGVQRGEVATGNVQIVGIVGTDPQQFVLADRAGQAQDRVRQPGAAEGPVEVDRVLADQRDQHRIGVAGPDLFKYFAVVRGAERHISLGHHLAARLGDVGPRLAMRDVRPDIVVTHRQPAFRLAVLTQPMQSRLQLACRDFADREHARRGFAALVQRCVDDRDVAANGSQDALADGTGVHADQRVDLAGLDQFHQRLFDVGRIVGGVDRQQPAAAANNAGLAVEFGRRQTRRGHRRWAPDPGCAAQRHAQGHGNVVALLDRPRQCAALQARPQQCRPTDRSAGGHAGNEACRWQHVNSRLAPIWARAIYLCADRTTVVSPESYSA